MLFMAVTVGIVCLGVTKGIERAVTILMPLFFMMLVGMVVYAGVAGDMGAAVEYLFTPGPVRDHAGHGARRRWARPSSPSGSARRS
jgi:SNF family Na+-dependent transporter